MLLVVWAPLGIRGQKTSGEPTIVYCISHNRLSGRRSYAYFTCKNMGLPTDALHGRTVSLGDARLADSTSLLEVYCKPGSLLLFFATERSRLDGGPRGDTQTFSHHHDSLPHEAHPEFICSLSLLEHRVWDSCSSPLAATAFIKLT